MRISDWSSDVCSSDLLFLVEGDSAGGSARQARDKDFQAILPLRGKILNTWEVASGGVLASNEVHDLAVAIGCDPGKDDVSGLRYGKIVILADADSDGLHRSEEHTSELQSLMRISYAVCCLKTTKKSTT